jgi:hypothetical protein
LLRLALEPLLVEAADEIELATLFGQRCDRALAMFRIGGPGASCFFRKAA